MAVATKNRRPICVDDVDYLWWVARHEEWVYTPTLTVVSKRRGVHVNYGLNQDDNNRYVVVLGPIFRGIAGVGGPWRRFLCPRFGDDSIRPADVEQLIRWCTSTDGDVVEVSWPHRREVRSSGPDLLINMKSTRKGKRRPPKTVRTRSKQGKPHHSRKRASAT